MTRRRSHPVALYCGSGTLIALGVLVATLATVYPDAPTIRVPWATTGTSGDDEPDALERVSETGRLVVSEAPAGETSVGSLDIGRNGTDVSPPTPSWVPPPGSPIGLHDEDAWRRYHPDRESLTRWLRVGLLGGEFAALTDDQIERLWGDVEWRASFLESREAAALRQWALGHEARSRATWDADARHVTLADELERALVSPEWLDPIRAELDAYAVESLTRWYAVTGGADGGERGAAWDALYDALVELGRESTERYVDGIRRALEDD